ncbi:carbon-nitrogen hydrolase [Colletotrichum sublineola]|nr:carbon-nitrogen hydrolase [Colletotrichum sublineola]
MRSIQITLAANFLLGVSHGQCSSGYEAINVTAFKLAAIRQPPANFAQPVGLNKAWVELDLNATVAQALQTISEAKDDGVAFLAFPELYFPGYPKQTINTAYTADQIAQYVSQSMALDGPEFEALAAAFKAAGMYGSFGFSERDGDAIYMSQALIGPEGATLIHRRKLRPSGVERSIWSDGDPSGLTVTATQHGRMGMLECWGHFHPTMTFPMLAQMEDIHVAAFPYCPDIGSDPLAWESTEVGLASARAYATNSNAVVLMPCVGASAIFNAGGAMANYTDATTNTAWKYITTTVDTTRFRNLGKPQYDLEGEQSWAALQYMMQKFPAQIPRGNSTFFNKVYNSVRKITTA